MGRRNYNATSNNKKLVHWPLMGGLFGTAKRGLGGLRPRPVPPRCTKCNNPPINANVPTSYYLMWHYNGMCPLKGFNQLLSAGEGGNAARGGTVGQQSTDGASSSAASDHVQRRLPGHFISISQPHQLRTAAAATGVALGRPRYVVWQRR